MTAIDTRELLDHAAERGSHARGISQMAQKLVASEILKIAGEVRDLMGRGEDVLNLTVGDFRSEHFPIPESLKEGIKLALDEGHSNYPPPRGVPECREAVQELFQNRLGLIYPVDAVLIAGGARPMIAGTYFSIVNPGDKVIYSLPSWNNNHYCTLRGAERVEVETSAEFGFFPRVEDIEPHIKSARLICLNTPQNPTGTVMDPAQLERLCTAIVAENERRANAGEQTLYLMFDQVYWMLTFHGAVHKTPVELLPAMAPYTIFVDGISKGFAATGLRVGWAVGPRDVIERMGAILTHLGAWAPRPEQIATARLLRDPAAMETFTARMSEQVIARLDRLAAGVKRLAGAGHDVEAIEPAGAIYLSMRINIRGKKTPEGQVLQTDEHIRSYLLRQAGVALVPFNAFGVQDDTAWFRASVGAVSVEDVDRGIDRLERALDALT